MDLAFAIVGQPSVHRPTALGSASVKRSIKQLGMRGDHWAHAFRIRKSLRFGCQGINELLNQERITHGRQNFGFLAIRKLLQQ